ncbi:hypothetical protein LOAG_09313 [Loa loa]|uniref:Uncharacterized protein n=1 Tax=Loa loa TaxID=7209 RepID=A0A1I7VDV6_LOALO|nr:hypothetical protein LOAG_09313 [Loa loa]EFO19184.1 hypothetical protein LOAG_09313 [Loa loa]
MCAIKMHLISIHFNSEVSLENNSVAGCLPWFRTPTNQLIHETLGFLSSPVHPVPFRDDHRWSQDACSFMMIHRDAHTYATSKRSFGQISVMAAILDVLVARHSTDGIECIFMYCYQQERWLWNPAK